MPVAAGGVAALPDDLTACADMHLGITPEEAESGEGISIRPRQLIPFLSEGRTALLLELEQPQALSPADQDCAPKV